LAARLQQRYQIQADEMRNTLLLPAARFSLQLTAQGACDL